MLPATLGSITVVPDLGSRRTNTEFKAWERIVDNNDIARASLGVRDDALRDLRSHRASVPDTARALPVTQSVGNCGKRTGSQAKPSIVTP